MESKKEKNIIEETFDILNPEPPGTKKTKGFTADEHLKAQQKLSSDTNPLILQLQKEAREKTFLGSEAPSKKRGRPKKITPENTPLRTSTGGGTTTQQQKEVTPENKRMRRIKQILAYVQLYPHLQGCVPVNSLSKYDIATLDQIYDVCKKEASSEEPMEYSIIKNGFFWVLDYTEIICSYLASSLFKGAPVPGILAFFAQCPPGSFSQYLRLCSEAGQGVDTELREISIDFMDLFPNNVYIRIITKICYKMYDFQVYKNNDYLQKMKEQMSHVTPDPVFKERLGKLKRKQ